MISASVQTTGSSNLRTLELPYILPNLDIQTPDLRTLEFLSSPNLLKSGSPDP